MSQHLQEHAKNIVSAGLPLEGAKKVLILVHGRGGSAEDIIGLSQYLHTKEFALLAPQATQHTWYPYSFMAPVQENEPWLGSALSLLEAAMASARSAGIADKEIYLLGFSQGACLALEFAARNASAYGGIIAFTGGLIGATLNASNYSGNFRGTPVFIGSSNPDPHVPVERVRASEKIFQDLGAAVSVKIYNGMGHTTNQDEIDQANRILGAARDESRSS